MTGDLLDLVDDHITRYKNVEAPYGTPETNITYNIAYQLYLNF